MKEADPKMHTAEHLLNQTMIRLFDCGRCFSAHVEKKKSKCDYHFSRNLTQEEILKIEEIMTNLISKNLQVEEDFVSRDDSSNKYDFSKLPNDIKGKIRIIKIGDYDACPCIGQHVFSTKEIGSFKIISTDFHDGVLRVRYKVL